MCHYTDVRAYLECQDVDFACKIRVMFPNRLNLCRQVVCDLDCMVSIGSDICVEETEKMRNIQWMCPGRIGLWLKSIDLIRFLPVIFSTMLGSTANRISWYTVRTRCNIVRLQTVAVVMLNRILTVAVQTIAHHHTGRAIEAIFQIVAHQTEIRQTHPACFHRTRAGHTVTFALLTHFTLNMLKTEQKQKINRLIQHIYTYIRQCFD